MRYTTVIICVLCFVLCGCSEFRGRMKLPKSSLGYTYDYNTPTNTNYFRKRYEAATDKEAERNRIVFELMGAVDEDFSKFERALRSDRAYKDIAVKWTSIGLTAGASLASQGAANILAAIDTGLKGANEAVDKNAFRDNTPEVLINKMRAKRAEMASQIYESMNKKVGAYPLEAAIRDVSRYYSEGFVTSALAALAASTAIEAKDATQEANQKKLNVK